MEHASQGQPTFLSDGGGIDNSALVPLIARLCRRTIAVDASLAPVPNECESDRRCLARIANGGPDILPPSCSFEQIKSIISHELAPAALRFETDPAPFKQMNVGVFPYPGSKGLDLTIYYLRLGVEPETKPSLLRYLSDDSLNGKSQYCDVAQFLENIPPETHFPMAPTERENFSNEEFRAYKALGRFLVHQYLKNLPEEIEVAKRYPSEPRK
jgi:hypothetical protein